MVALTEMAGERRSQLRQLLESPRLLRLQNVARREMETLEAAFRLILVQTGQVVNDIHLSDVRLQSRIRQHG